MRYDFFPAIFIATAVYANHPSSLQSLYGDETTAPLEEIKPKPLPGDQVVPPKDEFKEIDLLVQQARNTFKEENEKQRELALPQKVESSSQPDELTQQAFEIKENIASQKKPTAELKREIVRLPNPIFSQEERTLTIFSSNLHQNEEEMITLPSGSHAFGRVKFGEEVTFDGKSEALVELDYAFLGPNESVVEMVGCVVWLNVSSNFHTQRVTGSMQDMTCTMQNGRVFTVTVNGPLVSAATEYAGVDSDMIMRGPARVAALKFLGDITSAYGAAASAVETTTQIVGNEKTTERATNVTGEKNAYIQGKVLEANGDFLKYVSSFFSAMQPTLALAPGVKVHLINRHNVKIPKSFFRKKTS